jgi:putative Mn2+ efflux pump MntP
MVDAIILALALAMDATAIAAVSGAAGVSPAHARRMAAVFALFHVAMTTIGWMVGALAEAWISAWDHWVAFGLLAAIGGKMVFSALRPGVVALPATWGILLALALASSIDAIAAGVTLPLVDLPELVTIALIAIVVYVMVLIGALTGGRLGARFGRGLQVAGGVALIALGAKVALEHVTRW